MAQHFDVVVLGAGSGLTAAYWAEKDGRRVALVDSQPDALGGTCVNRGCIPTKGLIQSAEVLRTIRNAAAFGVHVPQDQVRIDAPSVFRTVHERRAAGAKSIRNWVEPSFTPFYQEARFVGPRELELEDGTRITGDVVFVCTGARPMVPPVPGLDDVEYWTNEEAIDKAEVPRHLIILGGGYVGCEFGHFFAEMGSKVTVVEMAEALAPEDEDIRSVFRDAFGQKVRLLEHRKATRVEKEGDTCRVHAETKDGDSVAVEGDRLLVAAGRTPNADSLGLEAAGIKTRKGGWIEVDDHLRTTCEGVYAYGDVIGQGMFKHTSSAEGEVAYQNSQGADRTMDYAANPHAVFSDPQIGAVGKTEQECRDEGLRFKVAKKEYGGIMKGEIVGSPPGIAKLIVEEETDRILGFHMAGPQSADLVHEVVVAMNAPGAKAEWVRRAIHIHPTMPELVRALFDELA